MASDDSRSVVARQPDLAMRDELTTQLSLQPPRFVVINTAGVVELEKRRPVDTLALILEERSTAKLEQFFRSYGAAEVAAMCFMLATQSPSTVPQASHTGSSWLLNCSEKLRCVLRDPLVCTACGEGSAVCFVRIHGPCLCKPASILPRTEHVWSGGVPDACLHADTHVQRQRHVSLIGGAQCTVRAHSVPWRLLFALHHGDQTSTASLQAVMQQARQALESPRLTGEAVIKEAGSGAHQDQNTPPNQGFDMGQVSNMQPKATLSDIGVHLCSRLRQLAAVMHGPEPAQHASPGLTAIRSCSWEDPRCRAA